MYLGYRTVRVWKSVELRYVTISPRKCPVGHEPLEKSSADDWRAGLRCNASTPAEAAPAFEVASVKISAPGSFQPVSLSPYGTSRFTATNAPLDLLLQIAFGVQRYQILGEPDWVVTKCYDISAKAEDSVVLSYDQVAPRLQQLLAQRVKLSTHHEMKDFQGYALVVQKGGPKLKEAGSSSSVQPLVYQGGLRLPNASMDCSPTLFLARPAGRWSTRPGSTGNYDIELAYAREDGPNSSLPSLFTALQEKLGLKLETQKVSLEMLVIDHVERIPTEN